MSAIPVWRAGRGPELRMQPRGVPRVCGQTHAAGSHLVFGESDGDSPEGDLPVNVGDSLSGPRYPRETANRLLALDLPTVGGNHDRQLVMLRPEEMGPSDRYADGCLNDTDRRWLAAQPATLRAATDVFVCHGTPASDSEYFLEEVEPSGVRCASPVEIEARAVYDAVIQAVSPFGDVTVQRARRTRHSSARAAPLPACSRRRGGAWT